MEGDWIKQALCKSDNNPGFWISSRYDDIQYAKSVCLDCPVRVQCLYSAIYDKDDFVGVNGSLSEIEYLLRTWERVDDESEDNWQRSDSLVQQLFTEIA